jgi:cyclopropane-fatty-acyl-phospholipid synthase
MVKEVSVAPDESRSSTIEASPGVFPKKAVMPPAPAGDDGARPGVAAVLEPVIAGILGAPPPVRFVFWDGSSCGTDGAGATVRIRSAEAVRRVLWAPGELGFARAFVAGEIDVDGDVFTVLERLRDASPADHRFSWKAVPAILRAAHRLNLVGRPPAPPPEEVRPRGLQHSKASDARAISHHYDVAPDFYRILLGPSMTYSCARFVDDRVGLAAAQEAKHELICRKLGLHDRPGARLLDVGCGWGSLAMHAASRYGARVVGITISAEQVAAARERVRAAGLDGRVEIRLQDYRDLSGETFDAISSVGMFEHVGTARMAEYFQTLYGLLAPRGRLLNHAISSVGGAKLSRRSFMARYVFPDGELIDVGEVVLAMERARFEVRDVESLREHYARTLRAWLANLQNEWDRAVALVGVGRARVWRLYMTASAIGFEDGGLGIHQVLGVKTDRRGRSGMPRTRRDWN